MATNHGHIQVAPRETKKPVPIPTALIDLHKQNAGTSYGDVEKNERLYAIWGMRAITDVRVRDKVVRAGDTFEVAGNDAMRLAGYGDAEFLDPSVAHEKEVLAKIDKLKAELHKPQPLPLENFPKPERKSWVKGEKSEPVPA